MMPPVPWHFISHRPLQLLVMRLLARHFSALVADHVYFFHMTIAAQTNKTMSMICRANPTMSIGATLPTEYTRTANIATPKSRSGTAQTVTTTLKYLTPTSATAMTLACHVYHRFNNVIGSTLALLLPEPHNAAVQRPHAALCALALYQ
jgi:hypothetical protein